RLPRRLGRPAARAARGTAGVAGAVRPGSVRSEEGDEGNDEGKAMSQQPRKMSEIMKEMSETLLREPDAAHSSEAAHVALMFANVAWNEAVGLGHAREGYRSAWEVIEAENPELWNEFKSTDVAAMLDELVAFKKKHYPHDLRRILTCGIPHG